jgi:hypothetical protein
MERGMTEIQMLTICVVGLTILFGLHMWRHD